MAFVDESGSPRAAERDEEPGLLEIVEKAGRQVATGLVVGAACIAIAIYSRPGPPRFQAVGAGADVVRIDTRSGAMISCSGGQCFSIHKQGEHLAKLPQAALPTAKPVAPANAPAVPVAPPAPAGPASH